MAHAARRPERRKVGAGRDESELELTVKVRHTGNPAGLVGKVAEIENVKKVTLR